MEAVIGLVIIGTAIWMAIDSASLGYRKQDIRGLAAMGPVGWLFAGLLLWIVAFPLYLAKRETLKQAGLAARGQASNFVAPATPAVTSSGVRILRVTLATLVGLLVVMGAVGAWMNRSKRTPSIPSQPISLGVAEARTTPTPIPEGPRVAAGEVAMLTGKGMKKTRPFTVSDRWELHWESRGDLFTAMLQTEQGDLVDVLANQTEKGPGSTFVPKGGTFLIDVNAMGPWAIKIVQLE